MKTCLECKVRPTCQKPCEWLEKQLKKVTRQRDYHEIPMSIDILEEIQTDLPTYQEIASYFTESKLFFKQLTSLQNKILKAFYFEGMSYEDVAKKFDITTNRVKNIIHRVKKKLKIIRKNRG